MSATGRPAAQSGARHDGVRVAPVAASVKALAFDVFGTVVDWRASIIREGELLAKTRHLSVDWPRFADAWRAGYEPAMAQVRRGDIAWTILDDLHRGVLVRLLAEHGITGLGADDVEHLNRVWHRLAPWPDSVPGLTRLRARFILATLSNGNVSLLVNMARHARLPWDCVLSAELAGHYKPDRDVYLMAARLLGLAPAELMMVAAHSYDLGAARDVGFRTAYVHRPLEHGPGGRVERVGETDFDVVATDFLDLAAQLGT